MERLELTFVDLLFRIQPSLFPSHVSRTQYQSGFGLFVDEENHQITARISPAQRFVHILALSVPLFNKAELRVTLKDILNFVLRNCMLGRQLVHYVSKPNNFFDFYWEARVRDSRNSPTTSSLP